MSLESSGPEDTRRYGEAIGRAARAGDVILLSGELGAGKTIFVQGIARGLGYGGTVSSKSFVIMGEYQGREKLYHADLYRLDGPEQVEDLGLSDISEDGVLVIEWPERGEWALPEERLFVQFEVTSEDTRSITAMTTGARAEALLAALETLG